MAESLLPTLFPLFADLRGRNVLVVGAGSVAARKIAPLLDAGARVQVIARELGEPVRQWLADGRLQWISTSFSEGPLDAAWLVVVATSDAALNARVAAAAERHRVFVNVVDQSALSSFQSPAVVRRGPLQVAVSSGGTAPVLARQVRERIERVLDDRVGDLASLLHRQRVRIRQRLPQLAARRRFLETVCEGTVARFLAVGDGERAEAALVESLEQAEATPRGFVSLVGAGPGDAGLLTLKALRRLQEADVILHDRLVPAAVLAMARRDAECIETGKQAGNHYTTQQGIHALMLGYAQRGLRVVRLKGGDPFVFGRGGEELEFLRDHAIDFEVVPGITAALACAAHAGIPLTHRDHAQSVRIVTAHCRESADTLDWSALAQERQTLAFYMGVAGLEDIRAKLLAHGRAGSTPCALVENGGRPEQRVIAGELDRLPALAERFKVVSPALLIVGEVAALATRLHWFGAPPLMDDATPNSTPDVSLADAA